MLLSKSKIKNTSNAMLLKYMIIGLLQPTYAVVLYWYPAGLELLRQFVVFILCAIDVRYAPKKTLPCTVHFTLDRLMKTEVKRLLNGL